MTMGGGYGMEAVRLHVHVAEMCQAVARLAWICFVYFAWVYA